MKGNIVHFIANLKKVTRPFPFVFSYGNDKKQLEYAKDIARQKYIQHYPNALYLEIDLNNQKKPLDYITKHISNAHSFFSHHFFIYLHNLPEKHISDLLDLKLPHLFCSFFVNLSHIPLFYKNITKYDLNPSHYFVSTYPLKPNEKEMFIASYLNSAEIQIDPKDKMNLMEKFSDDFTELRSQLEKIGLYVFDSKKVTSSDADSIFNTKDLGHIDSLFLSMLLGQKKDFDSVLNLSQNHQFDPHFIARSFLKYLKKLFYISANQADSIPTSFEGLTPYVLKLINPHIHFLKKNYSQNKLFLMIQQTNKMEEELRVTQKDPIQTLNQFWFQFKTLYIVSNAS